MSFFSVRRIFVDSLVASGASKRQSSTASAFSEKIAKFTPLPSQVAPGGYGRPCQTRMSCSFSIVGCGEFHEPHHITVRLVALATPYIFTLLPMPREILSTDSLPPAYRLRLRLVAR